MQNWKKRCVFGHSDKFWKEHDGQIKKKNACKNVYLGSIFLYLKNMCLGCVLKVILWGWYPAWNTSAPPPPPPPMKAMNQARRKRCGMAAVAAPKICRERERKGRERRKGREKKRKKTEREEKKERKGEESKRELSCIKPIDVKHPLRTVNRL